jgi:hypothetical protein
VSWILVKHVLQGKDLYLVWSTVVDAPISNGCSLEELRSFWKDQPRRYKLGDLADWLKAGVKTLAEVSILNRAGRDETSLTEEQIIDYYFVRKGKGRQPVGKTWDELFAEERTKQIARFDREKETSEWGSHCLHPDTCNPSKGRHGCICNCDGCRHMKTR